MWINGRSREASRSRVIGTLNYPIALIFYRRLGSGAAETPVKFQSDLTVQDTNLGASRLCYDETSHVMPFLLWWMRILAQPPSADQCMCHRHVWSCQVCHWCISAGCIHTPWIIVAWYGRVSKFRWVRNVRHVQWEDTILDGVTLTCNQHNTSENIITRLEL